MQGSIQKESPSWDEEDDHIIDKRNEYLSIQEDI